MTISSRQYCKCWKGIIGENMTCFCTFRASIAGIALFANVHAGWEKGSVENLVGYARRNYLVPLPEGADLEAVNASLRENCLSDQQRIMARRTDPIASRLAFERAQLGPLPTHAPDLGPVAEVLVHSTGRVRFQTNDYSAPIHYAYHRLTRHPPIPSGCVCMQAKSWWPIILEVRDKRQVIEDWRNSVPLLLKKSFAVPWASALRNADLPSSFEAARQDLVARRPDGNREFARLLELCLTHTVEAVDAALALARGQGDWSADTVRHRLGWAAEPDAAALPLDPARYPARPAISTTARPLCLQSEALGAVMTEDLSRAIVTSYLKQLRLSRMASDCEALDSFAEQRGLGYLGYAATLCLKGNWLSARNSSCANGSKLLPSPTRSGWRTLIFR
jgi:hypothetical protein